MQFGPYSDVQYDAKIFRFICLIIFANADRVAFLVNEIRATAIVPVLAEDLTPCGRTESNQIFYIKIEKSMKIQIYGFLGSVWTAS